MSNSSACRTAPPPAQRAILLGLLLALNLGFDLVFSPLSKPAEDDRWSLFLTMMPGAAVFLAQPALLALWAAMGPLALARRLPHVLLVLATTWFASVWASTQYQGHVEARTASDTGIGLFSLFVVLQLPFWLMRWLGGWRIESAAGAAPLGERQFGLRQLFVWTAVTAAVFAAARYLVGPDLGAGHGLDAAAGALLASLIFGGLAIPVLLEAWAILLAGRRPKTRAALIVVAVGLVGIGCAILHSMQMFDEATQLAGGESGALLAMAFNLAVVRACGYRLVRSRRSSRTSSESAASPSSPTLDDAMASASPASKWRTRRFAVWTTLLLALSGALVWGGVRADRARRQRIEELAWMDHGFAADYQNGRPFGITYIGKLPPTDEQLALLDPLEDLDWLNFQRTKWRGGQLARLKAMKNLRMLDLSGSTVTDADLADLRHLQGLRQLFLHFTDVGNVGLLHLKSLSKLQVLNVEFTNVTEAGASELRQALPSVTISFRVSDALVARQWKGAIPASLHLRGPDVTDASLTTISAWTGVEHLDLRDSAVSDQGLAALATLKNLKRLDLRRTQVTTAAVERLRAALPGCEIER